MQSIHLINFILTREFKIFMRMPSSLRIRQLATSIILISLFVFIIFTSSGVHVRQINMDLRIQVDLHTLPNASIVQKNQSLTDVGLFNYNNNIKLMLK